MPKLFPESIETTVKTLSEEKNSRQIIKEKLKEKGTDISISTISRILNNIGISRQAAVRGEKKPKYRTKPVKRTQGMINKVKGYVNKRNPDTYRYIKNKTGLSLPTIHKIIHHDLRLKTRKKTKVHRLTPKNRQNRKTNCRKLYENYLAGARSEFAVTLDEAFVYMKNVNGQRRICYVSRDENVPDDWVFERDRSFSKGFMIIGIITGRGTIPLFRVPTEVKINAQYYVDYVLKPLFTEYLPRLYPTDMDKVFFHHDKASSHTANYTNEYLEQMKDELGISYLNKKDIPVKCPDGSPLDFFGFGFLKQKIFLRRATTLDGVWKICQEVWSEIDLDLVHKVFNSWKRRLRLISAKNGLQIEGLKDIHTKKFYNKNL